MTDILERAAAALEGVTSGPWKLDGRETRFDGKETHYDPPRIVWPQDQDSGSICKCHLRGGDEPDQAKANARFIAAARQLVPDMAAEIAALRARAEALEAGAEKVRRFLRISRTEGLEALIRAEAAEARITAALAIMDGDRGFVADLCTHINWRQGNCIHCLDAALRKALEAPKEGE